jgi:hypothetical protein
MWRRKSCQEAMNIADNRAGEPLRGSKCHTHALLAILSTFLLTH